MRNRIILFVFAALTVGCSPSAQEVDYVIDGDTFVLKTGERVRLIGIDTPESQDPNKPVEYFSERSKEHLESLVLNKSIRLEYGPERTDKYRRLLCYVWVDDTVLVNLEIIRNGYGMAYLRFFHHREAQFLEAELDARRDAIGMWASPRSIQSIPVEEDETSGALTPTEQRELLELLKKWDAGQSPQRPWLKMSAEEYLRSDPQKPKRNAFEELESLKTQKDDITVYITRTGSKYHRGSCGYLRKSKIPISKSDATARGFGPCSRCRP